MYTRTLYNSCHWQTCMVQKLKITGQNFKHASGGLQVKLGRVKRL